MSDNPYTDDEYDSTYKDVHGDEPAKDQHTDQTTDNTFFPSGVGGSLSPSGWGLWPTGDTVDADYDGTEGEHPPTDKGVPSAEGGPHPGTGTPARTEDEEMWLDEGLITLLLVVGVGLFLFPEPATSTIGMALIAVGLIAWAADKLV